MKNKTSMIYRDEGSGFPIIFGHSYFFSKEMWEPQIKFFSKYYRVIVPDLWGHGDSPSLPSGRTSIMDLAEDHYCLIKSLGINQFAVVGLSVGGMWGAELACLYPESVKALVLMDTDLGSEPENTYKIYFNNLDTIDRQGQIPVEMCEYLVSLFYTKNAEQHLKDTLYHFLCSLPVDKLRKSIVPLGRIIFGREDRLHILNNILCPVLVMNGEYDIPRPPSEGIRIANLLSCQHQTIPGAAHISNIENADFVNTQLLKFFKENLIDV